MRYFSTGRTPLAAALALALSVFLGSQRSDAAVLSFDYTSGIPATIATVTGTGGTMNFTLDLNDPTLSNVYGNFSMDVYAPGNTLIGTISLDGGPLIDGVASQDFGSIALPGVNDIFPNVSMWSLAVVAANLPLNLVVTSTLNTIGDPLNPVLTVNFTGDLALAPSAVPLPATLPMLAGGVGILALLRSRRASQKNVMMTG